MNELDHINEYLKRPELARVRIVCTTGTQHYHYKPGDDISVIDRIEIIQRTRDVGCDSWHDRSITFTREEEGDHRFLSQVSSVLYMLAGATS